ncbi:MAG: DNA topoisomerase IB [Weeksellaceae bacterium]
MPQLPTPQELKKFHIRYVDPESFCFTRVKKGKKFAYLDQDGKEIKDPEVLERFDKLRIPPAWEKVMLCDRPEGHLQATGYDAKGRKQYLYHEEWHKLQQQTKFNRMIEFGEFLPTLRRKIRSDMNETGLQKERVLATVVWLLENTLIRVGNEEYAKENQSYGLTTMRMKHLDFEGNTIHFQFKGKSGVFHDIDVRHKKVAQTLRKIVELPGYEIFQYLDDEGKRHAVDSQEVNDYLKAITGEDITAKDFRTWGGTVLAADTLNTIGPFDTKKLAQKNVTQAVKEVAKHLRNTVAVCRSYYIHPTVTTTYQAKVLIPHFIESYERYTTKEHLPKDEFATWTLLKEYAK